MSEREAPTGISAEDWAAMPVAVRLLVLSLLAAVERLSQQVAALVERVLTAVAPLRQQERDVLDYLTEACASAVRGEVTPSLLPDTSVSSTLTELRSTN